MQSQDQSHRTSVGLSTSSSLAFGRNHLGRGHGPGCSAFHTPPTARSREERYQTIVMNANGFPYSRKLQAHNSCVNALAFSSGEGRFLASGGDDQRIHLWDFYQDDVKSPSFALRDLKGPLFCLEFSATNKFLFSCGCYDKVLKYDVEYIGSSMSPSPSTSLPQIFSDHLDSIRSITCHPVQDDLFMSASEDGRIVRHDGRSGGAGCSSIQVDSEATGVQYHPTMEHIFVTSDIWGRVCLRDARMAFGYVGPKTRNAGVVLTYNTKITKRSFSHLSNPEASSVVFDREGKKLAVTFLHYLPTIYALSDPNPLAVLSGANLPDGTPNPPDQMTYSNSCTMKHGSFGGGLETDYLYAAGSDDFRGYVWKIPPLSVLEEQRKVFSANEWENRRSPITEIAFTRSIQEMKYLPTEISTPLCRLSGHKTIVNSAVFHPHFLHVVTAGVEKSIHLHSPTPSSPCAQDLSLTSLDIRQLNERDDQANQQVYLDAVGGARPRTLDSDDDDDDDGAGERETISFFDHVLKEELGQTDLFLSRRYLETSSEEDLDEDLEEDSDDVNEDSMNW